MPPRTKTLATEHLGVSTVEAYAMRGHLSVARPLWDHEGIDLLVYVVSNNRVKAVGVQVKSYTGTTWRIDTKYHDELVMAYVWNATTTPRVFVMRAKVAKQIAHDHTASHNTRGGMVYDPSTHNYWTFPKAPRDLCTALERWEVPPTDDEKFRKVCGL